MPNYVEFEVTLRDIKPRLWRRFQIAERSSFGDLHRAIRDSFGWYGGHLWEFQDSQNVAFAGLVDDFVDDFGEPTPDAEKVKLAHYFGTAREARSRSCMYLYDFGDGWAHAVKLTKRLSSPDRFHHRLLTGRRACPPEDCGGIDGYYRFATLVETGADPWKEDSKELRDWLGSWQPDAFDLQEEQRSFNSDKALPATF